MHQRYTLIKHQSGEWMALDRKTRTTFRNNNKQALIHNVRSHHESKYCKLRKNKLIVSIKVTAE